MGGFAETAQNTHLDIQPDFVWLVTELEDGTGGWSPAVTNLSQHIGNKNGQFAYPGSGFNKDAKNTVLEGDSRTLYAELSDRTGKHIPATIDLDSILTNSNGSLIWDVPSGEKK